MQDEPRLTASFCIKGASTFRRRQRSGPSCSTTPTEQDTRASRRRSPGCARRSSVRRRPSSHATTSAAAWCANGTKRSISTRPAFFNPSTFRHLCGATSPWTSLRASPRSAASRSCSRWWTVSPKWHTSCHWVIRTRLCRSLKPSSTTLCASTVFLAPLSVTGIRSSPALCGRSSSLSPG